jgi:hypothetical protein
VSDREWEEFVRAKRESTIRPMAESAFVVQLVPKDWSPDDFDVKFALELGASIMMDKPVLAVLMPGVQAPAKLLKVADEVVSADVDTARGQARIKAAIERMTERTNP